MSSLTADLEAAAQIGADPRGGVSRFAWTPELARANDWLGERLSELGLEVGLDPGDPLLELGDVAAHALDRRAHPLHLVVERVDLGADRLKRAEQLRQHRHPLGDRADVGEHPAEQARDLHDVDRDPPLDRLLVVGDRGLVEDLGLGAHRFAFSA